MSEDVGAHVEELLAHIGDLGGSLAAASAEELVRVLVDYYGAGIARIAELAGPDVVRSLTADPQVSTLLVLHGLHPLDLETRIEQALDGVRPYLGSHAGGVSFLGVDGHDVARLRLSGSCRDCSSSTATVQLTIEQALLAAAPELHGIEVEGVEDNGDQTPLLQIGLRPGLQPAAVWQHPAAPDLPARGAAVGVDLGGTRVLMARLADTYYAYADACPSCGAALAGSQLAADVLTCAACAARYDVRLAGVSADGSGLRLDPLPLLDDVSGVRVAVPALAG
ncbi:MAG TPA: NifU family protein [Jatrophihabitantaceae bacterium]|jgi:Fe-S cluster biogenesis protein NfuA/nitrite reductase/ring-hydroxylating ferredoxin subunit|nr:NifU family protein [Jatrophihabitantaceae bacterium]